MIEYTFSGFISEMEKLAGRGEGSGRGRPMGSKDKKPRKKEGELRPEDYAPKKHQERAIDRLVRNRGKLIMAHGTGTGKTFTAVRGFKKLKEQGLANRALVITPAGLKRNFIDEGVRKFSKMNPVEYASLKDLKNKTPGDFNVVSYALFRRHPELFKKHIQPDTLIADEIQKAKNWKSQNYKSVMSIRPELKNAILTTASPVSNKPGELLPLLNIVSGKEFPQPKGGLFRATVKYDHGNKGFMGLFKRPPSYRIKERSPYTKAIRDYTDMVTVEDIGKADFPEKNVNVKHIPMNEKQKELFDFAMGKLGWFTRWKMRNNLPLGKEEAQHVFQRIQQARAVSNGIHVLDKNISLEESAKKTPKIITMMKDIKDHLKNTKDAQVVIYSNLIHGGVDVIKTALEQEKIPYGLFVGKGTLGSTEKSRNQDVEDFKKGKKKVIILSGAGAEGLSFNDSTFHASMDGHFNPEVIKQSEARSVRLGGQSHRKPEERKVIVKRYMSVFPKSRLDDWFGKHLDAMDEQVYKKAEMKEKINKIFREVVMGGKQHTGEKDG